MPKYFFINLPLGIIMLMARKLKYFFGIFLVFWIGLLAFSQKESYPVSGIPDSLKINAHAVIREQNVKVLIKSSAEMQVFKKKVVSILDRKGDGFATFYEYYDDFSKIKNIEIEIYDAEGEKIKSVKRKEIKDYNVEDGFSLYNDTRILYYHHISNIYPYTISISYEIETSNTAFIPGYIPVYAEETGIENSHYSISYPGELQLHYKEKKSKYLSYEKKLLPTGMEFSMQNVKPLVLEDYAPPLMSIVPQVHFALEKFSLAGVEGEAKTWQEMGVWMNDKLLQGRSQITTATQKEISALTEGITDDVEKAKKIYRYMQDKTRYVSIQIGIGGWRPMPALEVDQKGYGDCKALVNYTKSLMDVAGIKTYYSIVYGGDKRNIDKDLVSLQGNHVILMYPVEKDTIWLECTSQKMPFGHLGDFTDDRDVFALGSSGSQIVHTRKYSDEENYTEITGDVSIREDKGFWAKLHIEQGGKAYDDIFSIKDAKIKDQKDYYKDAFSDLNIESIDSLQFRDDKDNIRFHQEIQLKVKDYLSPFQEGSYFFRPNIFSNFEDVPPKRRDRKYPVYIASGFRQHDRIDIELPETYEYSSIPEEVNIESEFGTYSMRIRKLSSRKALCERELVVKEGTYSAEKYKAFRRFLKNVHKSDLKKVIIKKL